MVLTFMECRVVHDDDRSVGELREQILFNPRRKNVSVHILIKQPHRDEAAIKQSADYVYPPFCVPILRPITSLADWRVTMCAWHVVGKTAFINVNNFQTLGFVRCNLLLKDAPFFFVCLRMLQRFFYRLPPVALRRS